MNWHNSDKNVPNLSLIKPSAFLMGNLIGILEYCVSGLIQLKKSKFKFDKTRERHLLFNWKICFESRKNSTAICYCQQEKLTSSVYLELHNSEKKYENLKRIRWRHLISQLEIWSEFLTFFKSSYWVILTIRGTLNMSKTGLDSIGVVVMDPL